MTMLICLCLGIAAVFLAALFKLASVFRLTIPLLYALIVPTVFHSWCCTHEALAEGIWFVLLGLVALSWVISFLRFLKQRIL